MIEDSFLRIGFDLFYFITILIELSTKIIIIRFTPKPPVKTRGFLLPYKLPLHLLIYKPIDFISPPGLGSRGGENQFKSVFIYINLYLYAYKNK